MRSIKIFAPSNGIRLPDRGQTHRSWYAPTQVVYFECEFHRRIAKFSILSLKASEENLPRAIRVITIAVFGVRGDACNSLCAIAGTKSTPHFAVGRLTGDRFSTANDSKQISFALHRNCSFLLLPHDRSPLRLTLAR